MKIIVDTSILIDYLRGGEKGVGFIEGVEGDDDLELFVPTIVVFELFSGQSTKSSIVVTKILNLLKFFQRIELTEDIAKRAGQLFRDTKKIFQVQDYIIAASALQLNATVATLNKKHFEQIPHLALYPLPSV